MGTTLIGANWQIEGASGMSYWPLSSFAVGEV